MNALYSARTIIRPFSEQDAPQAFSWFGDFKVMKFTPNGPDANLNETIARIAHYQQHQVRYGFAKWLILDRNSLLPIGDSGPMYFPECQCFELGYRLLPDYWQQGLATEVAGTWIRYCFQMLGLERLMAFAHPDNFASIRVLEKVGFSFIHRGQLMGMDAMAFNIENDLNGLLSRTGGQIG